MKSTSETPDELLIPTVTEDDVQEVVGPLGLIFDKPRRDVLLANGNFDVQACPGSGKTTLLIAKLAILAKKWPHSRRGICVLSRTQVARQEIEEKLSGTGVGERLMSYPHFVGTIHGFVNEFLALPLLRSEGRLVRFIDEDACGNFCQRLLHAESDFETARRFLEAKERKSHVKTIRHLIYVGKNLDLGSATGRLPCGPSAPSFAALLRIKSAAAAAGLWRFEDMFAFAERLLEIQPRVAEFMRWRFPACFIDEMQDTSELQIRVLAQLFPSAACALRQRFGDSNQAIFDRGQSRATTDAFPASEVRGITNSQRFGQTIATLVQPLAPDQSQLHLVGEGPPRTRFPEMCTREVMPHTVFLFAADSVQCVLPAFARLLLESFPPEMLHSERFLARAIGHVGRAAGETDALPRGLPDYLPEYEPEGAKLEPRPRKLADFIHIAQQQRAITPDCATAVATASRGITQLVELVVGTAAPVRGLKGLRDTLAADQSALQSLHRLLWQWCVEAVPLSEANWLLQLHKLRKALSPVLGDRKSAEAKAFCQWSAPLTDVTVTGAAGQRGAPNRYRFPENAPLVEIDVGTIHSAKGQTHTATLVLETFFRSHDIGRLLDWLVGDKRGAGKKAKPHHLDRLRLIYTAMTRPTHLLCLALREQALVAKRDRDATIEAFRNRGWQVIFVPPFVAPEP